MELSNFSLKFLSMVPSFSNDFEKMVYPCFAARLKTSKEENKVQRKGETLELQDIKARIF